MAGLLALPFFGTAPIDAASSVEGAGSEGAGYALIINGYRPLEDLAGPLERWLAAGAPVTKATS